MFRDNDPYQRRNGRSPYLTNIPGTVRQQTVDPVTEVMRLRQQLEQASNETAEWQQAAKQYHAIAQQQQAEAKLAEQKLAQMEQQIIALEAVQRTEAETQKSVQSAEEEKIETAWQEKYTRLYAEFENSKKRLEMRYALEAQQAQEKLLRDMLPLADNLERAIEHVEGDATGLEIIYKAFLTALGKYGVEIVEAAERPFDPELHEAIGTISRPNTKSGTIVAVTENGYTYQGNLLRPAKVLVAQ